MKHEVDLAPYQVRTDLISEVLEKEKTGYKREVRSDHDVTIETIVMDQKCAKTIQRKAGIYKTLSFQDVTDEVNYQNLLMVLEKELKTFLKEEKITEAMSCLIIGLGNRRATPDALGPLTIENITVTKHLFTLGLDVDKKYRPVAAIAPGVTGTTGIETKELLLGLIEKVKPDFLIAVDALAASSLERLNKTIQLTNTGIHPGSGVGNHRGELSKDTLGIPVIALGIPTVVDAVTIVSNTLDYLFDHLSYEKDHQDNASLKFVSHLARDYKNHEEHLSENEKKNILGLVGTLTDAEKHAFIAEVLMPLGYNLIVTPKEVDFLVEKLSQLVASAINNSLEHP